MGTIKLGLVVQYLSKQHCLQRLKTSSAYYFLIYTSQNDTASKWDLIPATILVSQLPRRFFSTDSGCLCYFSRPLWSHRYSSEVFNAALLNHLHKHGTLIAQRFQLSFRLALVICTLKSNQNISSRVKCIRQGIRKTIRFITSSEIDKLTDSVTHKHLYDKLPFYKSH